MTEHLVAAAVTPWFLTVRLLHAAVCAVLLPLTGRPIRPFPTRPDRRTA